MRKILFIVWLGITFFTFSRVFAQTRVIAHRGYWNCEGSAQNSLAALNKAYEIGAYGSELDVLITADGVPVVNHDDSIGGIGIETAAYEQLKEFKLANEETLPTLEDYLQMAREKEGIQLILEIKPHKRVVNEDRAVAAVLSQVDAYGLTDRVEYISFSMNICKELVRRQPTARVFYLGSDVTPADVKALGFSGIDYYYKVFDKHPEWIREAQSLGLAVNVWTVNDPEVMQLFIDRGVDFITTDQPIELQKKTKAGR